MNEAETRVNVEELGEKEFTVLKGTYCKLQELRTQIHAVHAAYVADGTPPDFDRVEALKLLMDEVYDELERFLLPVCANDGYGPSMCS